MTSLLQEAGVPRQAREAQGGSGKAFQRLAGEQRSAGFPASHAPLM